MNLELAISQSWQQHSKTAAHTYMQLVGTSQAAAVAAAAAAHRTQIQLSDAPDVTADVRGGGFEEGDGEGGLRGGGFEEGDGEDGGMGGRYA